MEDRAGIAANVARLRLDRELTQEQLADKAGFSRVALGKIERGVVIPREGTLTALAKALAVPVGVLVTPVRPLKSVRFRAKTQVHGREQILAEVSKWLDDYKSLEVSLGEQCPFKFNPEIFRSAGPESAAQKVREIAELGPKEPVRDICGLLEKNGVKLLLLDKKRDSFFGLSAGEQDGGPAIVVNRWDRISVERWIFTAAHELGHLLLHPGEYQRDETDLSADTEREADAFASEFLMPEEAFNSEWNETYGHPLLIRVLKVKRIFRVSYKTVLYRLVESERAESEIWRTFQRQHRARFGKTLRKVDEPLALEAGEFAWSWRRSEEPDGLSYNDFVENRLSRLVRRAVEEQHISRGRAAEILGITREEMRKQVREWAN